MDSTKFNGIYSAALLGFPNVEVKLDWDNYNVNGTIALRLMSKPDAEEMEWYKEDIEAAGHPFVCPFAMLTVNLPCSVSLPENAQFIDTNNNPGAEKWLEHFGIAKSLGFTARSGYCEYPAYQFNFDEDEK